MNELLPGNSNPDIPRWGMVVDVNRCVGCQTCTVACKHANDTVPGVQWRGVLDVETGTFPDVERIFLVVGCQHCAEPPCVPVCPTGATEQRGDGIVTMDYDLCIGCASCAVACPYQARTIVHEKSFYFGEETIQEKVVSHDERLGVAQKCTFCVDRVDGGIEGGLTPGKDWKATPACSSACIASAIKFGDFNDPNSEVSRLTAERNYFQMHAELGTDPQIKYLYETPSVPGRELDDTEISDAALSMSDNPLSGKPQTFWDLRAAMNFIMGGLGAGFIIMTYLLYLTNNLTEKVMLNIFLVSGIIIAIGLFFVWLKIGRKLRAFYVVLKPQNSWMSREVYAAGLLYLAGLIDYFSPSNFMHFIIAIAALAFLYCQARILHSAKGIPTWRAPKIPWILLATGFYEGFGLLAIYSFIYPQSIPLPSILPVGGLVLAAINALLWRNYVMSLGDVGVGQKSQNLLLASTLKIQFISYLLPSILTMIFLVWGNEGSWTLAVAGILVVVGSINWKILLITKACHQQGYAIAKFPQRGSGRYAAPTLSKVS